MGFINRFIVDTVKSRKTRRSSKSKPKTCSGSNRNSETTQYLSETCVSDSVSSHATSKVSEDISNRLGSSSKSRKSSKSRGTLGKSSKSTTNSNNGQRRRSRGDKKKSTNNLKTVQEFIDRFNNFTCEEDLVSLFASPEEFNFMLEDGFTMTPKMWANCSKLIYASFPNMKFTYDSIQETRRTNEVVVEGLRFSGTHTGAPFSFAPQKFPPIPANGCHVVNDEERFVFELNENGKIQIFRAIALGTNSGPHGMYEQLGGCLVPTPLPSPPTKATNISCRAA